MKPNQDNPTVKVKKNGFEYVLRVFNRRVIACGILKKLKERKLYPTAADRRRLKRHRAKRRRLKAQYRAGARRTGLKK